MNKPEWRTWEEGKGRSRTFSRQCDGCNQTWDGYATQVKAVTDALEHAQECTGK